MRVKSIKLHIYLAFLGIMFSTCAMAAWTDEHQIYKSGIPGCDYVAYASTSGNPGRGGCVSANLTGLNGRGLQNGESECIPLWGTPMTIMHSNRTAAKSWENGDLTGTNYVHTFGEWINPSPEVREGSITLMTACYCPPE
jgi:hypothetical protein